MTRVHVTASREYDVLIGQGLIDRSGALTAEVLPPCRCMLVSDSTVAALYAQRVSDSFVQAGYDVSTFTFPAGESSKTMKTLEALLNAMGASGLSRSDFVVALGGGVVGDLAGLAAAVYSRGVPFVQIPTTLLAAVDSSVGGKTAVDMPFGKNMVGAFHQPSLVLTDTDALRALPRELITCGAGEIIKCGVLNDHELFVWMETGHWLDRIETVVARCVAYKRDIVAEDEFDTGRRAFLNLGHTFGHAIEQCSGLSVPHGMAVGLGALMAAAAAGCDEALLRRLARCLTVNGLPVRCPYPASALAEAALADKKRSGRQITLVLPQDIGRCVLQKTPVAELPGLFSKALAALEALEL